MTLGVATVMMTFAAEFFSHVISAGFAFAAFCLLMKERDREPDRWAGGGRRAARGPRRDLRVPDRAGRRRADRLRTLSRRTDWLRRGALPMPPAPSSARCRCWHSIYWAFGNPLKLAYGYAVDFPGVSGHDVLGLNSAGLLRDHRPALRQRRQPAARRPRAAGADSDHRHGRDRRLHDAPPWPSRGGQHDPRHRRGLLHLQQRLLAALRRRHSGPALPDPGPPVPGDRPGLRVQAAARRSHWGSRFPPG